MTVIDFISKQAERKSTPPESGTEQVKKGAKSKVFALARHIQYQTPQIHPERITERDLNVEEFFVTLTKQNKAEIISPQRDISREAVIIVGNEESGGTYEMTVKDFIRITEPRLGGTLPHQVDDYLLDTFAFLWIKSHLIIDPNSRFPERDLSEDEIEFFTPEDMKIAWESIPGNRDSYDCMIETHDGMGIFISPRIFIDACATPMLYMLMHAREEYIREGYDMREEHNIQLCAREGMYVDTLNIPLSLLEKIIVSAINRTLENEKNTEDKVDDNKILHLKLCIPNGNLMHDFYQDRVIPSLAGLAT